MQQKDTKTAPKRQHTPLYLQRSPQGQPKHPPRQTSLRASTTHPMKTWTKPKIFTFLRQVGKVRVCHYCRTAKVLEIYRAIKKRGRQQASGNLPGALDRATYLDANLTRVRPSLHLHRHLLLPGQHHLTHPLLPGHCCPLHGHHQQCQQQQQRH